MTATPTVHQRPRSGRRFPVVINNNPLINQLAPAAAATAAAAAAGPSHRPTGRPDFRIGPSHRPTAKEIQNGAGLL